MSKQLPTEEELLIMKGSALRMKFKAQTNQTKKSVAYPFSQLKALGSPMVRSVLLTLLSKRLLTAKALTYSALGVGALLLLNRPKNQDSD
ncbi:hypothetical protein A4G20_01800 [Pasteurellaceae bacterium RH1A]|nr:hypothetical protein A4G20_01800 [Pasteurellaceae bacterium RH1A]